MARRRLKRNSHEPLLCGGGACGHGGACVRVPSGDVCVCAGPWGGHHCSVYVGHDAVCHDKCQLPAVCVWGPDTSPSEVGTASCVCPVGKQCTSQAAAGAVESAGAGAGAWAGAILALVTLAAAVFAALFFLHRRRHGAFVHARLSDNVEINNPMYLAGEDEHDVTHTHTNGGKHFANPVYESVYSPQQNPTEEQANLLSTADSPPPAERVALL